MRLTRMGQAGVELSTEKPKPIIKIENPVKIIKAKKGKR